MLTIAQIIKITHAHKNQIADESLPILELIYDSRRIMNASAGLFFAVTTTRNDGHKFIESLYKQGVRNFVVSKKIEIEKYPEANFLLVTDTVEALQQIAIYHRKQFNIPIIGITGSNGKTVIKEWLWQLLSADYHIVRSPKSYNSQIGVPISVWQMSEEHNLGIFEAGVSTKTEMKNLAQIIDCKIGIFTNIGDAHNEGFQTLEEKTLEKAALFENAETIIYCSDYALIEKVLKEKYPHKNLIAWSFQDAHLKENFLEILPFDDHASQENALHCVALMRLFGYSDQVIVKRLHDLQPVALRLEMKNGTNRCLVINDSYNADLASLRVALDFLKQQAGNKKRTVICSDFLQTGITDEQLSQAVEDLFSANGIHKVVTIGNKIQFSKNCGFIHNGYSSTEKFLQYYNPDDFQDEAILVKGARAFAVERIVHRLEVKAHKTVLEINLNAFAHNFNVYKGLLKPGTHLMCMVKAVGYGAGTAEVARLLERLGADYLAVAYSDEGIDLREAGVKMPVLVLNPEESSFDAMHRFGLEPEIYSLRVLRQYIDFITMLPPEDTLLPIHIKLDTGMRRLGFEEADIPELIEILNTNNLVVKSVFSHLVASDNAEHDDFTHFQINLFEKLYNQITEGIGYKPWRHILNSGGITRFPEQHWEMVRLGIGLYGIDTSLVLKNRLTAVRTLKATISQIKRIKAGETVGYNRAGKAEEDKVIATISIGYADGFWRKLSNGIGEVLVRGRRAPVIGSICMDMTMIDVTKIPQVREGDEVVIFGSEIPVQELAAKVGTIPYEILTGISERVTRVCYED